MGNFVETEHPRDKNGQFIEKGKGVLKNSLVSYKKNSTQNEFKYSSRPNYSKIKEEYENAVDEGLLNFINEQKTNPSIKSTYSIGKPTQRHINDIKRLIGVDVSDWEIKLDGNKLGHIDIRHGKNGKADHSMADPKDLARIKYVLDNYDTCAIAFHPNGDKVFSKHYRNKDNTPSQIIELKKRINGYYIVSEAVVDAKNKRISIESAYKTKKNDR